MNTGSYLLIIKLSCSKHIKIGRKAVSEFPSGYYVYTGSAMNNLDKRINPHLSSWKKFHWNIDWLLSHSDIIGIKRIESDKKLECDISRVIHGLSQNTVMPGFGSSDCSCKTHLHYFTHNHSPLPDNIFTGPVSVLKDKEFN